MTDELKNNELKEEQLENVAGGAGVPQGQQALYQVGQQVIVTIRDEIGPACMPVNRREEAVIISVSYGDQQYRFFEPGVSGVKGQGFIYNVRYLRECRYPTEGIPECFVQPV